MQTTNASDTGKTRTCGDAARNRGPSMWRQLALAAFVLFAVTACENPEKTWVNGQMQRCYAMGGNGAYQQEEKLFECFRAVRVIRIDVNKHVDREPSYVKLFESCYAPRR